MAETARTTATTSTQNTANAVEAAQSVAAAVSRVADAAVAEVRKVAPSGPPPEVIFTGSPGGRFRATGSGFGPSGTIHVGGRQLKHTGWSTTEIVGEMPADVSSGDVVVKVDDKVEKRGHYVRA